MLNHLKQAVLRGLYASGYVVVRKDQYQLIIASSGTAGVVQPQTTNAVQTEAFDDPKFRDILIQTGLLDLVRPMQGYAIYSAAHYIHRAKIPGDLIDCGNGSIATTTLLAATLASLGDTSRNLILFDVTGDPAHFGETELLPWGSNHDCLEANSLVIAKSAKRESLPKELLASRYPAEKISIVRFPKTRIDFTRPLAFLAVVPETYSANRSAIAALVPKLSRGGVIVASGDHLITPRQAIDDIMERDSIDVALWNITKDYRIGVRGG